MDKKEEKESVEMGFIDEGSIYEPPVDREGEPVPVSPTSGQMGYSSWYGWA